MARIWNNGNTHYYYRTPNWYNYFNINNAEYKKKKRKVNSRLLGGMLPQVWDGFIWLSASQVALMVDSPPASAEDIRDLGSIPGLERSLEKEMETPPVFLPGESHGQRSLVSYSP